jgi:hypothetical protein
METYHDISIPKTLSYIRDRSEITLMRFDVGIAIQTPHCPSSLGFFHLQSSAMGGNWQELKAVTTM